ncbi:MAG: tol-pal system protein YbgF [Sphingobacteriia bacterium]|nr:tol-pal system protein YbgF [Sphingobacteriia bacterium]
MKINSNLLKALFLTFVITTNHALAEDNIQSRLADRMERLERDLNILQKQFYRTGGSSKKSNASGLNTDAADLESRVMMIEEQMRDLNGKVEEVQFYNKQLSDRVDILNKDIDFRFEQIEKGKKLASTPSSESAKDDLTTESTTSKTITATNDQEAFDKKIGETKYNKEKPLNQQLKDSEAKKGKGISSEAIETGSIESDNEKKKSYDEAINLIKKSELDKAAKVLETFIGKYGDDPLVGNAYYWYGEVFYVKKQYQEAAIQYLKGYKQFPKGKRAPDTLLKLSMSLGQLKKLKEACSTIDKLYDRFPDASASIKSKADKEYKRLGCTKASN